MEIVTTNPQNGSFHARGACPHCSVVSLHMHVASPTLKAGPDGKPGTESNSLVQCQSCHAVTFVVVERATTNNPFVYKRHFPFGNPEESVTKTVPPGVREDYVEALKCYSVTAYKGAVVMCRRSLQSSCKNLKADGPKLIKQIDDLAAKGVITAALKDMAHDIRKLGNDGAHPDEDGLGDVSKEDANDIIEFTRQYFEHVYVMPARSKALRERREAVRPGKA